MTKWRTFDHWCQHCGNRDNKVLWDLDSEDPNEFHCTECGELSEKVFGCPTVMNAALVDGQRKGDECWQRAKTIADLKVKEAETFHGSEERKEIQKEIAGRSIPITKGGG